MLLITTLLILAFAIKYTLSKGHDDRQLIEPRAGIVTIGIQIICGDCSGDSERPVKTYLDRHGNCAQCGGHSYMLASSRSAPGLQLTTARHL